MTKKIAITINAAVIVPDSEVDNVQFQVQEEQSQFFEDLLVAFTDNFKIVNCKATKIKTSIFNITDVKIDDSIDLFIDASTTTNTSNKLVNPLDSDE